MHTIVTVATKHVKGGKVVGKKSNGYVLLQSIIVWVSYNTF